MTENHISSNIILKILFWSIHLNTPFEHCFLALPALKHQHYYDLWDFTTVLTIYVIFKFVLRVVCHSRNW